jgi:hypothetical protein
MSLIRRKNPDGSLKDWVVAFRRNGEVIVKHFRATQFEEAQEHHDFLLRTLPPPNRHKRGQGTTGKTYADYRPFKLNGCSLTMAGTGVRCEKNTDCIHYDECLTEAAKRNWNGFKIEKEAKKCRSKRALSLAKNG